MLANIFGGVGKWTMKYAAGQDEQEHTSCL